MTDESFFKIECPHCSGRIEFPANGLGRMVSCPHCGGELLLNVSTEDASHGDASHSRNASAHFQIQNRIKSRGNHRAIAVTSVLAVPLAVVVVLYLNEFATRWRFENRIEKMGQNIEQYEKAANDCDLLAVELGQFHNEYNAAILFMSESQFQDSIGRLEQMTKAGDCNQRFNALYSIRSDIRKWMQDNYSDKSVKAMAGDMEAQTTAASMMLVGVGTSKNELQALEWSLVAARRGSARGQLLTAVILKDTNDPDRLAEACRWASLSLKQGMTNAGPVLHELEIRLAQLQGERPRRKPQ